jgi:hypothetical protein
MQGMEVMTSSSSDVVRGTHTHYQYCSAGLPPAALAFVY